MPERGIFYCSRGDPITGSTAITTEDLTGVGDWHCVEFPVEQIAHWTQRSISFLERLGLELF